ncbi:hypothetical protein GCM10022223_35500 [Kineosporia mesophila]|uniref:Glycosyltransferase 2-like domain-containing protein n=2 Tax=Kineosporia mesophila TaxID=566012 RepID=A0ABP6ZS13_9ACTN
MTFMSPASTPWTHTQPCSPAVPGPTTAPAPDRAADYRASHSSLLGSIYGPGRPVLPPEGSELGAYGPRLGERLPGGPRRGGIVVPTCRDFLTTKPGLIFAAELAQAHDCYLFVVLSRDARAPEFPASIREMLGEALILIELDEVHADWGPGLESSQDPLSALHRVNDVGRKRNLGLMLGQRLGWEFLLFLDDDISPHERVSTLDEKHLAHALRVMTLDDDLQAVGWPLVGFDDNSVVGHARPLADLPQDIFISSGALLLRCTQQMAYFPENVYNEDWLLMIMLLARSGNYQRALAAGGPVRQQEYDAFCPVRARSEEVGEILGEGLMNLVEDHGPGFVSLMSNRFWKRVKAGRRTLLRTIMERVADRERVVDCMNTALQTHGDIPLPGLTKYARTWWQDHEQWELVLVSLQSEARDRRPEPEIAKLLMSPRAPWQSPSN